MGFQPKFFDLVRNYTSTTGTGNLVLGKAVAGFASFADVLQPGDEFYYSVLGLEKTGETEVGRGTFEPDGTIARSAMSGSAMDFSAGLKTVSLVAAAQWYTDSDAAIEGRAQHVPHRAALAAADTAVPAAYLREQGREGMFIFDGGNLSAKVAADEGQGVYVAPASDPTGASGAWVRQFTGAVHAKWFGTVENDEADELANATNLKAINRAIHLAKTTAINHVIIPAGTHYVHAVNKSRWAPDAGVEAEASGTIVVRAGAGSEFTLEFEPGAILKRTANDGTDPLNGGVAYTTTELSQARILIFRVDGGETYRLVNAQIDGNEANYPFAGDDTSTNQFLYQHAHDVMFTYSASAGATAKAKLIEVRNLKPMNAVGAGCTIACLSEALIVDGIYTSPGNRSRRYRSDFEQTLLADRAWIDNVAVDAFEYEPVSDNASAVHWWGPNNVARSVLDILGQATDASYLAIHGWLPRHSRTAYGSRVGLWLYRLQGDVGLQQITLGGVNSTSGTPENAISRPKLTLRGGKIVHNGTDADATIASQLTWWTNAADQDLELNGVTMECAPTVTSGAHIKSDISVTGSKSLRLINCRTDGLASYVVDFTSGQCQGTHILDGGRLRARTAIMKPATGAGTYNFHFRNIDQWRAPALIDGSNVLSASATCNFYLEGTALLDPAVDGSGVPTESGFTQIISAPTANYALAHWHVHFVALVNSNPATRIIGIPGVVARLRAPAAAGSSEWIYANGTSALNNSAWQARAW